ncbi:MAG TPA: hypothetical protein VF120_09620, partial [Ktedonobacterales bacterium]
MAQDILTWANGAVHTRVSPDEAQQLLETSRESDSGTAANAGSKGTLPSEALVWQDIEGDPSSYGTELVRL